MLDPTGHEKSKLNKWLIKKRDEAISASAPYHKAIEQEQRIYRNLRPHDMDRRVGKIDSIVSGDSLYPKIAEVINKIHPRLDEGLPRAKFLPDSSDPEGVLPDLVNDIQDWHDMYEEVDNEGQKQHVANFHVLTGGMSIRKARWDTSTDRLNCPVISPLTFSPDPRGCEIDLSDAGYVVQSATEDTDYLKRYYMFRRKRRHGGNLPETHRIDEMWVRKGCAEDVIKAERMVKAVLIDDKLVEIKHSPWIYPDFPYSCWRNFLIYSNSGKPNEFWGFGFAKFLWRQQKVLDELLANLLIVCGNTAVGRYLIKEGAVDQENLGALVEHGGILEILDGFTLEDFKQLEPHQIPAILFQFVQFIVDVMEGTSGVNPVFSGEAPFAGVSGRAVAALQAAAFTHISNLLRGLIAYRTRLARMKAVIIQQMARKPVDTNLWRGGVDIQDEFPKDARHIGFQIQVHDTSTLPQSAAARLQVAQYMFDRGMITAEKFLELSGFDKGYGIGADDIQQALLQRAQMQPLDEEIIAGGEVEPNQGRVTTV